MCFPITNVTDSSVDSKIEVVPVVQEKSCRSKLLIELLGLDKYVDL